MSTEPKAIMRTENDGMAAPASAQPASHWLYNPDVDVLERGDEYIIALDLPGVPQDQIELTVENWTLTVRGRVSQRYPRDGQVIRCEYGLGDYYRQFRLGESIDPERISAEWANGTLTIHLPKAQSAQARQVPIQQGRAE
jgi:HSP20 family protein